MMNVDQLIVELQKLQHQGHGKLPVTHPHETSVTVTMHEVITEVSVVDSKYYYYTHQGHATVVQNRAGPHVVIEWN